MAENNEKSFSDFLLAESPPTPLPNTPMIDRAMRQMDKDIRNYPIPISPIPIHNQPAVLLTTIERSLRDVYEWACEQRGADQGLLYDLNTAINLIERCAGRVKHE